MSLNCYATVCAFGARAGYPLFPGEDESDQLALIIELLGMPPQKLLDASKRTKLFFTSQGYPRYCQIETQADGTVALKGGRSKRGKLRGPPMTKTWQQALKGSDDVYFIDFLRRCLQWDPDARMTPREALKHDWMRKRTYNAPPLAPSGPTSSGQAAAGALALPNAPTLAAAPTLLLGPAKSQAPLQMAAGALGGRLGTLAGGAGSGSGESLARKATFGGLANAE